MINKYSSIPLYSQLKNVIIEKIENGEYAEDSKIPSEQEFCDMYDISRPTVRQAISELTNNGCLYKEKGKGTFVAKSKAHIDIRDFTGFTDSILDSQVPGEKDVVFTSIISNNNFPRLGDVFEIPRNHSAEFAEISYVTKDKKDILSLNISYLPINLFPSIIDDIKESKPSYDILRGKYPLIPFKTRSSLEVIYSDQSDSQFLHVQTGQPLIRIENVLTSKSGQVVELVISKYRADKCRFIFANAK